jgi:hypothetical protein
MEVNMGLDIRATMLASAVLWALVVLLTAVLNALGTGYGTAFLQVVASIYPGYHASGSVLDVITGTVYAFGDGAIFGLVFAWLYNYFVGGPLIK